MRRPAGLNVTVWGNGEPAVFVHGSFGWGEETWHAQRPLADDYELRLVDRRGYGGSPPDGPRGLRARRRRRRRSARRARPSGRTLVRRRRRAARRGASTGRRALADGDRAPGDSDCSEAMRSPRRSLVDTRRCRTRVAGRRRLPRALPAGLRLPGSEGPTRGPSTRSRRDVVARATAAPRPRFPSTTCRRAPFPKLVVRGGWDKAPRSRHRSAPASSLPGSATSSSVSCDAESAAFPGVAHRPQELGEPFNQLLRDFWSRA